MIKHNINLKTKHDKKLKKKDLNNGLDSLVTRLF